MQLFTRVSIKVTLAKQLALSHTQAQFGVLRRVESEIVAGSAGAKKSFIEQYCDTAKC